MVADCFFIARKKVVKMEMKDTIPLMESNDCKDRLKAEYHQTKIRFEALHKTIVKATNEQI